MNKVETKKHWYDKPLKFVYFILALMPFIAFLFNYIQAQANPGTWNVYDEYISYSYKENGKLNTEEKTHQPAQEGTDHDNINNSDYYYGQYNPSFYTALILTNAWMDGDLNTLNLLQETPDDGDGLNETQLNILGVFSTFKNQVANILLPNATKKQRANLYTDMNFTIFNILFYELALMICIILFKVILFLPNVICNVLDWVERRLGRL